jgi:hypothetical protein
VRSIQAHESNRHRLIYMQPRPHGPAFGSGLRLPNLRCAGIAGNRPPVPINYQVFPAALGSMYVIPGKVPEKREGECIHIGVGNAT